MLITIKKIFKPQLSIKELVELDVPQGFFVKSSFGRHILSTTIIPLGLSSLGVIRPQEINGHLPHIYAQKQTDFEGQTNTSRYDFGR